MFVCCFLAPCSGRIRLCSGLEVLSGMPLKVRSFYAADLTASSMQISSEVAGSPVEAQHLVGAAALANEGA